MSDRDVGGMAESTFEGWCKAYGITANKSLNDENGWDYFVQFPPQGETRSKGPLDVQPPELSCLLLGTGTDRNDRSRSIKFSNWEHLVKNPLPVFFLVLEFDNQLYPENCFLIHLGENWIAKVLKKLRELPVETELHRKTMVVNWSAQELLANSDGSTIREAIERLIGGDMKAYITQKQRWLDTVGYEENGRYEMSVRMQGDNEDELMKRLVDFATGISEKIPVTGITLSDRRFGISVVEKAEEFERADISMQRSPDRIVQLRFRDSSSANSVILHDAAIFNPRSVFPFIDSKYLKIRIMTEFIDFFMLMPDNRMTITFKATPLRIPFTIGDLHLFRQIARTLIVGTQNGLVIEVIDTDWGLIPLGRMVEGYEIPKIIRSYYSLIEDAGWLANRTDIDPHVLVSPEQLHDQHDKFRLIRALFEQPSTIWFEIKVSPEGTCLASSREVTR